MIIWKHKIYTIFNELLTQRVHGLLTMVYLEEIQLKTKFPLNPENLSTNAVESKNSYIIE